VVDFSGLARHMGSDKVGIKVKEFKVSAQSQITIGGDSGTGCQLFLGDLVTVAYASWSNVMLLGC
jgi:hypothetical protein